MENTSIAVAEFLPDGVSDQGDLFAVSVDPFSATRTLGSLCPTCVNGVTAPVPPFNGTFSASQGFPAEVTSATLAASSLTVAVRNGFSFDPIAGGGSVVITITDGSGGKTLGQTTISTALPPGATVARGIQLVEGPLEPDFTATVVVTSPGGQVATIDTSDEMTVDVEATSVRIESARVNVAGRAVSMDVVDLDVGDIDESISDRIQAAAINLAINNPFAVGLTATLDINYPGGTLSRNLSVDGSVVSEAILSYTGEEFRRFMGQDGVTASGSGTISASAGPILVRPGQRLLIDASIDLTLIIG
jgi:hypothetical protein